MSDELTPIEPQYLFAKNRNAAESLLDQVNAAYGYPNPATKTDRAVDLILHPTENWALIPLDLAAIWSPKNKGHREIRGEISARVSSKDFELVSTPDGVAPKDPFCRISESVARQLGFFPPPDA